ncbi:MAG: hypothetical protein COU07_00085 [Candidatus Harrisonbacteria bacterium CG10_big_fil_rev_8_21_14_0_10_40_38]|uniref:RNA polymerase sigma factor n=1 Tax=Candidatus Harrisonbacteria bacterium CG10_big_fil_rev_8_21_14_0_10_40_38 TaxID=1974583 RepID=A0A2H0USB2_9BACT|nr:MAG: hypothetical protein COU07_00085 [Candidatus Harrisonbacteria bacterium CG10_big_fil_rev_8_21_14_0_10_40_38]
MRKSRINKNRVFLGSAYQSYSDDLFRYCFFKTSNPDTAKEIVQETFMRAMQYLSNGNEIKNTKAFLFTTSRNLVIDWYKKKRYTKPIDELTDADIYPASEKAYNLSSIVEKNEVLNAIDGLDSNYKEVLIMRYISGLKIREIADLLKENQSTITMRIRRGIDKLKTLLSS